jgi:glycosyltransferase involved in cell wall biosynthesis
MLEKEMNEQKSVDVVIPSYERLDYLMLAIKSAKSQTYKIEKIIVVDDNSSFTSDEFWSSLKTNGIDSSNIIFYKKENNRGACHSRNLGANLSESEFIAFLDDDDQWESDHIISLIHCFVTENIALAYSGKKITNYKLGKVRNSLNIIPCDEQYNALIRCNYPGSTSSILVRKKHFVTADGFDESLPAIQDYDFYLRLVKIGKLSTSENFSLIYRDDTGVKITNQLDKARTAFSKIINKTEPCFSNVLARTIYVQNMKKAILNRKLNYIFLFTKDYLWALLKSK